MVGGRLAAEVEARNLPGDRPPVRVLVLSGSEADLCRATDEPSIEAPELGGGEEDRALLDAGDPAGAYGGMGPPRTDPGGPAAQQVASDLGHPNSGYYVRRSPPHS